LEKACPSRKPKVFYGYWIVAAAFLCNSVYSGCSVYTFSLFAKPLQADFGWGRGGIMVAFTIYFLAMGLASPYIGRLVDRYGVRAIISLGAFVAGLGFVFLSLMNNLWHFYVAYIMIGVGLAAVGPISTTAVVSNWFKKHRGMTIGIMSVGVGAGGFVLSPLIGGYLIPNFGWRISYLALALITSILIPIVLLVIKAKPADVGLYPDGVQVPEATAAAEALLSAAQGLSLKMALATSAFWLIAISFVANSFSHMSVLQSQVPYLDDIGFPVAIAATALGSVGLASALGKFGFGWLCDQIPAKYACCLGLGLQLAAVFVLRSIGSASPLAMIWLYAIMMGLGLGSWLPTMSMLISTNFGLASYGAVFGMIYLSNCIGSAIGPLMAGYMYDAMNTYHWAFIIFLILYAVAIPAILAVRRPKSLE